NCATSSPIASIADQSCWTQSPSWAGGRSRSSPDPRPSGPSSQSLDDGSSNAPSLGSDAAVALPRIARQASPAPRRGSWCQASACSLAASQGLEMTGIILSQTLRRRVVRGPPLILRDAGAARVSKDEGRAPHHEGAVSKD